MLSRRGFLASLLTSSVAAATFDVERLLWIPGEKVYFDIVRPPCTLITPSWVTKDLVGHWVEMNRNVSTGKVSAYSRLDMWRGVPRRTLRPEWWDGA